MIYAASQAINGLLLDTKTPNSGEFHLLSMCLLNKNLDWVE